jgi:hypothetical protein
MADSTVAALTAASTLDGTELYYTVQGAADRKATGAQIKTLVSSSPTLVTPTLGVATATSINKMAITAPATSSTLAVADGKTLTASNTLTLTATDGSTLAIGTGGTLGSNAYTSTAYAPAASPTITGHATIEGVTATGATGTGKFVFDGTPTLVTPVLGAATGTSITVSGALSSGTQQSAQGSLVLNNTAAGAFATTIKSSNSATAAVTYTLPTAVGASGTVLTDAAGNGVLSWAAGGGGGATLGANTFTDTQTITQGTATHALLVSTGGSNTGSDATSAVSLAWTLNTSGSPDVFKLAVTDTAGGASTKIMNIYGGSSGTTSLFSVDRVGSIIMGGDTGGGTYNATIDSGQCGLHLDANGSSFIFGVASNTFQIGKIDAPVPDAQTLQVQSTSVGSGNNAGADFTIRASLSNGSGVGGKIIFKSSLSSAGSGNLNTAAASLTIANSSATGIAFNGYGAGALSTDASGNITATSDEKVKDIQGSFISGLAEIMQINPIRYRWKQGSGMETLHEYAGFGARNVNSAIPLATGMTPDGLLTLQDRALLATCVNAIKELANRIGPDANP